MVKKLYKTTDGIATKIAAARENMGLVIDAAVRDTSTQAEVRLHRAARIALPVDSINPPKNTGAGPHPELWDMYSAANREIWAVATIYTAESAKIGGGNAKYGWGNWCMIPAKTKSGAAQREKIKIAYELAHGNDVIAHLPTAADVRRRQAEIKAWQEWQKQIIGMMRVHNGAVMMSRRTAKQAERQQDAAALAAGEFWRATAEAVKSYFHPPFSKNYLADVSEKWRAALFLECESVNYKRWDKSWGHTLSGTGAGYLCGIDDNGDEWGFEIHNLPQSHDEHGNAALDTTVEDAMCRCFQVRSLDGCYRQGDLLFRPVKIQTATREERAATCPECGTSNTGDHPTCWRCGTELPMRTIPPVELHPQPRPWHVRESHTIASAAMVRNGRYFASATPIRITHTSHAPVILPPGEYCMHTLEVPGVDPD
jgi:hypothetical protein